MKGFSLIIFVIAMVVWNFVNVTHAETLVTQYYGSVGATDEDNSSIKQVQINDGNKTVIALRGDYLCEYDHNTRQAKDLTLTGMGESTEDYDLIANTNDKVFVVGAKKLDGEAESSDIVCKIIDENNFNINPLFVGPFGGRVDMDPPYVICDSAGRQEKPQVAPDGNGGVIIVWQDNRNGSWDIYAQRINANGNRVWARDGIAVASNGNTNEVNPKIVPDGNGGAIIVWEDIRDKKLRAQKLDNNGSLRWLDGIAICTGNGPERNPQLISDDNSGIFVIWEDGRRTRGMQWDVYTQKINSDGRQEWGWNEDGHFITAGTNPKGILYRSGIAVVLREVIQQDRAIGVFEVYNCIENGISYGASVTRLYTIMRQPSECDIDKPAIISDGNGGAFIIYRTELDLVRDTYMARKILVQYLDRSGWLSLEEPHEIFNSVDGLGEEGGGWNLFPDIDFEGTLASQNYCVGARNNQKLIIVFDVYDDSLIHPALGFGQNVFLCQAYINHYPIAYEDIFTIDEDSRLNIPAARLLQNDSDIDEDAALTIESVGNARNGVVSLDNEGNTIVYRPNSNYCGQDSFLYTVNDGYERGSMAEVKITINPKPDKPKVYISQDAYTVNENKTLQISVTAADPDPNDEVTLTCANRPNNARFIANKNGLGGYIFNWTPTYEQAGNYNVTFTATDSFGLTGSKTVRIHVVNIVPPANHAPPYPKVKRILSQGV